MTEVGAKTRTLILDALISGPKYDTLWINENKLAEYAGIDNKIMQAYLIVMQNDGYVELHPNNDILLKSNVPFSQWKITDAGRIFRSEGGYVSAYNIENDMDSRLRITYWVTLFLAVSTGIAAIYYGLEIWKYFHSYQCH